MYKEFRDLTRVGAVRQVSLSFSHTRHFFFCFLKIFQQLFIFSHTLVQTFIY
jgi:hypothetical protein